MKVRVLGPLAVELPDGTTSVPTGERQRSLLAVLAARANTVVAADLLVDLLWRDDPPANPAAALHSQIARLRRALAPVEDSTCTLSTRPPGYLLEIAGDDLDATRFARIVTEARASSDPAALAAHLAEGLGLWRGRPFGDVADIPVVEAEVARLTELRASAVELRATALLQSDRPEQAVAELEPFVLEQPLREGARAALMRGLYVSGRHAEALRHYERYRRTLAEEIGLEPSVALQRLHREILQHDVAPAVTLSAPAPAPLDHLDIRYAARHDGGQIAYTTIGEGAPLVTVPAWVSSLDLVAAGRDPRSSILERLAHHVSLVMYDRLGTGLSRAPVEDFSTGGAADELVALVEHIGTPASLFAMSQAGPAAILAAVRRPELVDRLVLFGTYASGPRTFARREFADAALALARAHWPMGAKLIADLYRPAASPEASQHFAQVLRESAEPAVAVGYLETTYDADVSPFLADVRCPALVLHYRGDRVIPFEGGRQLAAGLPDATFVPLDGDYHLPDAADLDRIVGHVTRFLGVADGG